ncbi:MAG: hypothetical protein ACP5NK_00685 [Thermoplasmata archaeon]
MRTKFVSRSNWNSKTATIYWIALFIAFGPVQLFLKSNQYEGSIIFSNDPFAYFMLFGITAASLATGLMYLFVWIWNGYISTKSL